MIAAMLLPALAVAAPARGQPAPAEFETWVAARPERAPAVAEFEQFLKAQGVDGILPTDQLLRTATAWKFCGAEAFATPPASQWPHLAQTLKFIHDQVQPALGPMEAVSGYRWPELNACAGGKPASGHLGFYALDLIPLDPLLTRPQLISRVCKLHAAKGKPYAIGLGFYDGLRFHLDSKGFRRWGPDGHSETSPCDAA